MGFGCQKIGVLPCDCESAREAFEFMGPLRSAYRHRFAFSAALMPAVE